MSGQLVLGLDVLADEIHRTWDETKQHQIAAWEGYFRVGSLLGQARDRFASDKQFGQWFGAQEFGFNTEWGRRLRLAASNEPDVRGLLATAVASSEPDPPGVNAVLTQLGLLGNMAVHYSSESPQWNTPPEVIERVVETLGSIDLDPCSNSGEPNVPAARYFTEESDGLAHSWHGRVYMNPPYGDVIRAWVQKLGAEYDAGRVTEAVALVPARTDTAWFRDLPWEWACLVTGRLEFSQYGVGAPFPSALFYLGSRPAAFVSAFGDFGLIVRRQDSPLEAEAVA